MRKIGVIKSKSSECVAKFLAGEGSDTWEFEKASGACLVLEVDHLEGIIDAAVFGDDGKELPVTQEMRDWAEKWIRGFWEGGQVLGFPVRQ